MADSYPNSAKLRLHHPNPNTDRLTQLPDSLLLQIISRLPTADAVKTGALSSHWKHLWKYVDQITLHCCYPSVFLDGKGYTLRETRSNLLDGALSTLTQSIACSNITKFSLVIQARFCDLQLVPKLIQWAFSRKVKSLRWSCCDDELYCFDALEWFCHSSSLESLSINCPRIRFLHPVVCWSSLKNLHLLRVGITDEDIAKVLYGCPVLQTLDLQNVRFSTKLDTLELNIVSPSLKTLRVDGLVNASSNKYDVKAYYVNAPWLEYLYYVRASFGDFLALKDASSLLRANLDLPYNTAESMACEAKLLTYGVMLLKSLCHVEDLVLGAFFVNVLSFLRYDRPCPLLRCKRLTIFLCHHKFPMSTAPFVETLVINAEQNWMDDKIRYAKPDIRDVDDAFSFSMPKVAIRNLKYLKISHAFRHQTPHHVPWHTLERCFRLAACITRNAPLLKELVIALSGKPKYCSSASSGNRTSSYFMELSQNLRYYIGGKWCIGKWFIGDDKWEITVKKSSCEIICKRDLSVSRKLGSSVCL